MSLQLRNARVIAPEVFFHLRRSIVATYDPTQSLSALAAASIANAELQQEPTFR